MRVMSRVELEEKAKSQVKAFLEATREEDPGLAKALGGLDEKCQLELAGVLGRFDGSGLAPAQQRLMARRFLGRLRKPSAHGLEIANRVLDYIDRDGNARLDDHEAAVGLELLEAFACAESDNNSLSERELELLEGALRHFDRDSNRVLDEGELLRLRAAIKDGTLFAVVGQ
ncbi:MAG TPA: hypothetical protein PLS53_04780 [Thermoanaerobaculaceae bacterium]|nr:hypothetical protein [Thermoanaerobaculaceae bacterium]